MRRHCRDRYGLVIGCLAVLVSVLYPAVSASAASLADTVAKIKPAIVGVGSHLPTRRPATQLRGTGFVVGEGKYIVTNSHVVDFDLNLEKREELVVLFGQGPRPKILTARIAARDRLHDVAILEVSRKLPSMVLADADTVREGDEYAFTGFPIGAVLGLYPVTHRGIVSSITPIATPAPSSGQLSATKINRLRKPTMVYQLDAIAYPGNSGSPLYDTRTGEVVGVLNQVFVKTTKEDILSKPSAISYAIPVKHINNLIKSLR